MSTPAMTAEDVAKHWHAEFAKGRPLHECFLMAVTTYAAQVRRDTIEECANHHDRMAKLETRSDPRWQAYHQTSAEILRALPPGSPSSQTDTGDSNV